MTKSIQVERKINIISDDGQHKSLKWIVSGACLKVHLVVTMETLSSFYWITNQTDVPFIFTDNQLITCIIILVQSIFIVNNFVNDKLFKFIYKNIKVTCLSSFCSSSGCSCYLLWNFWKVLKCISRHNNQERSWHSSYPWKRKNHDGFWGWIGSQLSRQEACQRQWSLKALIFRKENARVWKISWKSRAGPELWVLCWIGWLVAASLAFPLHVSEVKNPKSQHYRYGCSHEWRVSHWKMGRWVSGIIPISKPTPNTPLPTLFW